MRKAFLKIFILFFIIATLGLTLVACSVSADVPDRHTIIFYVGDDYYANIRTRGCEIITLPSDPTLDGYVFYGWYKEKVFSNEVTETTYEDTYLEEDQNVYAKFIDASLVASSYTVSFETLSC